MAHLANHLDVRCETDAHRASDCRRQRRRGCNAQAAEALNERLIALSEGMNRKHTESGEQERNTHLNPQSRWRNTVGQRRCRRACLPRWGFTGGFWGGFAEGSRGGTGG